ncbi:ATP-binding cassette domain-containing protein [bacterium]|nr:ATP-binding cassette domain-containing protein [bacterium]
MSNSNKNILEVTDLKKHFRLKGGAHVQAVEGVSFTLREGETLSIVGESGCGKSTIARLITRLHDPTAGSIRFMGVDLLALDHGQMNAMRRNLQLIFQDPFASLDSRKKVSYAIMEPLVIHKVGDSKSRWETMQRLLETVGLEPDAANRYPHEFSGGQRQRIGIARAIALEPKLIIADEPVSSLDVSVQSQMLNLLVQLRQMFELSYIFISHDLAVVKHISDKVAVMYLGCFVEMTDVDTLFETPLHPYTQSLLSAIPRPEVGERPERIILEGDVPDPSSPPSGCRFHPRCPKAMSICSETVPALKDVGNSRHVHLVSCHLCD